jgi:polyisoprenoid-binding protein YceI
VTSCPLWLDSKNSNHIGTQSKRCLLKVEQSVDENSTLKRATLIWALALLFSIPARAQSSELRFQFSPANTTIKFTLGDILHTIHGSFQLKRGDAEYDLLNDSLRGTLVADATSGQSGNRSRDRRMHREILESGKYPEIIFRPDHVEGKVANSGASTVQVHGVFSIHGSDHELTMPVRLQVFSDHWVADTHFNIPYVKWEIKNPSTFFLRVSESVEIDVHATGTQPLIPAGSH